MGGYCRAAELRSWQLNHECAAQLKGAPDSTGGKPVRADKKHGCENSRISGSCECSYADGAVLLCGLCSQLRSGADRGPGQDHAPQGRYMDGKCTISVAQGRCDFELGVRLCSAILSGTTKYGHLVRVVQQEYQIEALDVAAVYDIDSSGRLVVVSH